MPRGNAAGPGPSPASAGGPRTSAPGGSRPAGAGSAKPRRTTGSVAPPPSAGGGATAGMLRFYSENSDGLKVGPTVVLVLSVLFIVFVLLLHIWGKLSR